MTLCMKGTRALALLFVVALAGVAAGKERVVRLTLGPFRIDPERDREVCQAVRIPNVPNMELATWEIRSRTSRHAKVDSHHMVVYGYRGPNSAAFPHARNRSDVVDDPGCNGFGPEDFFKNRVQLAGSGGEFLHGEWLLTAGATPLGLATLLPNPGDAPSGALVVLNSHYINGSSRPARGLVRVTLRLVPYDGTKRVVRFINAIDASYQIDVPPGEVRTVSGTWQADGSPDEASEGGVKPDHDVCVLLLTTHTHKRGTAVTVSYEEDGKEPVTLLDPPVYDYRHPSIVALPLGGLLPAGNLLRAYTPENGHPRLRYACTHGNGADGLEMKLGCEAMSGVTPGVKWADALAAGEEFGDARPCGLDGANCDGFGTGRCVDANLVFGPLSDDEMCIIPGEIYDPIPGAPPETACDPYAS
jgi:hypothetical protein